MRDTASDRTYDVSYTSLEVAGHVSGTTLGDSYEDTLPIPNFGAYAEIPWIERYWQPGSEASGSQLGISTVRTCVAKCRLRTDSTSESAYTPDCTSCTLIRNSATRRTSTNCFFSALTPVLKYASESSASRDPAMPYRPGGSRSRCGNPVLSCG